MALIILALSDSTITGPGTIVKLVEGLPRKPSLLLHLLMRSGMWNRTLHAVESTSP
jgi:hypothetical protein